MLIQITLAYRKRNGEHFHFRLLTGGIGSQINSRELELPAPLPVIRYRATVNLLHLPTPASEQTSGQSGRRRCISAPLLM